MHKPRIIHSFTQETVPGAEMTKYELAEDKRITIVAIIFEILMVVACLLLGDAIVEEYLKIQTLFAQPVPIKASAIAVIVLQYLIVVIEMIARHRGDQRGLTIPLVFLPGGIVLRTLIMIVCEAAVIVFKLLSYFISVLLAFVFQSCRLDKLMGTSKLVDLTDTILEPLETGVNKLYNLLYFHKIRANTSVFTSVFNGSLSLWCINH